MEAEVDGRPEAQEESMSVEFGKMSVSLNLLGRSVRILPFKLEINSIRRKYLHRLALAKNKTRYFSNIKNGIVFA